VGSLPEKPVVQELNTLSKPDFLALVDEGVVLLRGDELAS